MKHCANPDCAHVLRFGRVAEYRDEATRCTDCDGELVEGAALDEEPAPDPVRRTRRAIAIGVGVDVAASLVSRPIVFPLVHSQLAWIGAMLGFDRALAVTVAYLVSYLLPSGLAGYVAVRLAKSPNLTPAVVVGIISVVLAFVAGGPLPVGAYAMSQGVGLLAIIPVACLGGSFARSTEPAG